ncbi:MAG: glycosyltransferase [Clostridiales bacterium]|nr:glycosyltransferase [Clostridiales bacterium]
MKILITTDWYSPAINGVVTSVVNLRQELIKEGHDVLVLTLSGTHRTWQEDNVIYIGSLDMSAVYPDARLRLLFSDRWMKKVLDWKPDIVHSQCEFSTFGLAKKISKLMDVPLVHSYHTIYEDYTHYFSPSKKMGKRAARAFTRQICQEADAVIAPTEKTADLLRGYQINSDVTVIPSGLVMERFSHCKKIAKAAWNIPENQTVLLYVGRLAEEKNLDEIFRHLKSWHGRNIVFLIVGDGPYRRTLEEAAKNLPETVAARFTGMVSPYTISSYYSLGDLFVSASQSETQGLTYIEAAATGLPLLCREDKCLEAVIRQGENGWQYRDSDDFLEKLSLFVETDFIRRNEMGICSRQIAEQFDIQQIVPRVVDVYKTAVSRRRGKEGEEIHECRECG